LQLSDLESSSKSQTQKDEPSKGSRGWALHREVIFVLLSLLMQVPLAVFLGHYYDERVFMATGYLVGSGLDPYQPHLFAEVFGNAQLEGFIPSIGYPPPWPLLLGAIYRLSFAVVPNLWLYNFAIKIPVIIGNIALAYLVRNLMVKFGGDKRRAEFAWLFLLFNPLTLLTTAAWGAFDTVVAFFCIGSLYLIVVGKTAESAVAMAFAVALKPIALPLFGLPLFFAKAPRKRNLQYMLVFAFVFFICFFGVFLAMGWTLPLGQDEWDSQFQMAGGLTPFNIMEIINGTQTLPLGLDFLGFLWLPALLIGYYAVYRSRPNSPEALFQTTVSVLLIFFLSRSWLSEPNINLLLPLMFLATLSNGKLSFRNFHFAWILPLVFLFLNYSFPQLFFLVSPSLVTSLGALDLQIRGARLVARFLVVILWQVLAWAIVAKAFQLKPVERDVRVEAS
jgi:hypothetical protein